MADARVEDRHTMRVAVLALEMDAPLRLSDLGRIAQALANAEQRGREVAEAALGWASPRQADDEVQAMEIATCFVAERLAGGEAMTHADKVRDAVRALADAALEAEIELGIVLAGAIGSVKFIKAAAALRALRTATCPTCKGEGWWCSEPGAPTEPCPAGCKEGAKP